MNSSGVLVDEARRQETLQHYNEQLDFLAGRLNRLIREGIGWDFEVTRTRKYSWPSNDQLKHLFYKVLQLPPLYKRKADGTRTLTVDREALEKLQKYFFAEPIIAHLLLLRDLQKRISFLETGIDLDGRIRTNFNIAGTNTGRMASSYSDFGTGTNLQNVENRLRAIFIADPGWKFCNIDLEQGDSRGCGAILWNLLRDGRYLDACESGDLHTTVARIAFDLPWTSDPYNNKRLADSTKFYRDMSCRAVAKRLGHGTNYKGQAETMAEKTRIPLDAVRNFQKRYLEQFPFEHWWRWVEDQLRSTRKLTTLLGRQRYFFADPRESSTLREAIAYEPQSITADTIDRGLLALWEADRVRLNLQVHDSVLFQYREAEEDEIIPWALSCIEQTVMLKGGRPFKIPGEAKVGWNWSDYNYDPKVDESKKDPDALRKFDDEKRPYNRSRSAGTYIVDRRFY